MRREILKRIAHNLSFRTRKTFKTNKFRKKIKHFFYWDVGIPFSKTGSLANFVLK